jgi:chromosomal replication initiation ATPase DnaA
MTVSAQLPLDLPHRPALGRGDFLISPSNELAVSWVDRWPDWPGGMLAGHGPEGACKTHLAEVWRALSEARRLGPEELIKGDPLAIVAESGALLLEDLDRERRDPPTFEQALLHLLNAARGSGASLLLTARRPPARWPIELPDLASRLAVFQTVAIEAPDDSLMEALLVKLFHDRQLQVSPAVVHYLLARMERSFAAARQVVEGIDRRSLAERRQVSVPLARQVLAMEDVVEPRRLSGSQEE